MTNRYLAPPMVDLCDDVERDVVECGVNPATRSRFTQRRVLEIRKLHGWITNEQIVRVCHKFGDVVSFRREGTTIHVEFANPKAAELLFIKSDVLVYPEDLGSWDLSCSFSSYNSLPPANELPEILNKMNGVEKPIESWRNFDPCPEQRSLSTPFRPPDPPLSRSCPARSASQSRPLSNTFWFDSSTCTLPTNWIQCSGASTRL